jgi:hypothetical protein
MPPQRSRTGECDPSQPLVPTLTISILAITKPQRWLDGTTLSPEATINRGLKSRFSEFLVTFNWAGQGVLSIIKTTSEDISLSQFWLMTLKCESRIADMSGPHLLRKITT